MNVTNQVAAEVIPELANVSIMFKAVGILFGIAIIVTIGYAVYQIISN